MLTRVKKMMMTMLLTTMKTEENTAELRSIQ